MLRQISQIKHNREFGCHSTFATTRLGVFQLSA
jgi:hypothetical protein